MTSVAVTGVSSPVGRALLERLDADEAITRIIGVDIDEPQMPVAKLEFRPGDLRDRLLPLLIEGADVVVHAGLEATPARDEDTLFVRNVHGTRNVLAAASKVGARAFVHLSDGTAYGAHPDNAVPLAEEAPLRANPDYGPAYHALLAEELVAEFAQEQPNTRVAVVRPATVLGLDADSVFAQHLEGPRVIGIQGYEPPLQLVHVDDVAAALHLAVVADLSGPYNAAADGWLSVEEACGVLGKRRFDVPETLAFAGVRELWGRGMWPAPPGMLHFLMHPHVLSASKLRAAGWAPTRSNREVLREFAAEHAGWIRLGPLRLRRRTLYISGFAFAGATVGIILGGRSARR